MRQSMDFFKKHPGEEILDLRKTRGGKLEGGGKLALIPLIVFFGKSNFLRPIKKEKKQTSKFQMLKKP